MADIELGRLDPASFEHMANSLALHELGAGVTMFGPGSDGGRDGYFEGEAAYPSPVNRWSGRWYIQSKFHAPHLSKNAQQWLREQIQQELAQFGKGREWPDNWIVITNIDASATPKTGTFDRTKKRVREARPQLADRFHIWGGKKVRTLLSKHVDVMRHYGDFLTAGHVITELYDSLARDRASAELIVRYLTAGQLVNQRFAKLEQAGSTGQAPGLHHLFTDLPFSARAVIFTGDTVATMTGAAQRTHRPSADAFSKHDQWWKWRRYPLRARTWFVRGGPGQGKSTLGQYLAQLQRAWFLLEGGVERINDAQRTLAQEIRDTAAVGLWPTAGRIPVIIELKDYAQWISRTGADSPRGALSYVSARLESAVQQPVSVGMLRQMLAQRRWLFVFDGLDEVPHDVKELVAVAVTEFLDQDVYAADADVFTICTSRPQGYSGQFDSLDACPIDLAPLDAEQALRCAEPLLKFQRSEEDARRDIRVLKEATANSSVRELMTTPLQSHIMAVVVRSGGRPPERRWKLFENFYQVILRREAGREGLDPQLLTVFKRHDDLLKTVHDRLGFALHASAETSSGAQSNMTRSEFESVVRGAASDMLEQDIESTVAALMEATTDRLVLVNTPDDGDHVRFDVRQLQEFFAAEFLLEYDPARPVDLRVSFEILGADPHWREVAHFLLSALVEGKKGGEIDALASVLQRFDSGPEEERMLWRRMARGAFAAARLLSEGVLEQDRRVREQIRQTLGPIFASTNEDDIAMLASTEQPQTRAWLIGVLIDALRELSLAESVGAAAALVKLLPNEHPRVAEVVGLLSVIPASALALIARVVNDDWPTWFLRLLAAVYRRPIDSDVTGAIVSLRQTLTEMDFDLSQYTDGWSDRERLLLSWVVHEPSTPSPTRDARTGIVADFFENDWSTGVAPAGLSGSGEGPVAGESFLAIVDAVARFAQQPIRDHLESAAGAVSSISADDILPLPIHIQAWLPLSLRLDPRTELGELQTITEAEFALLMSEREFRGKEIPRLSWFSTSSIAEMTDEATDALVRSSPDIALWASQRDAIHGFDEGIAIRMCESLRALAYRANLWGYLVSKVPQMEKQLRVAFREGAATYSPLIGELPVVPFRLGLPDEAPLLPHIAATFATYEFRGPEIIRDLVSKTAAVSELRMVRDDRNGTAPERLGATVLLWLHPDGGAFTETPDALATLIERESMPWFVPAAARALATFGSPSDAVCVRVAAVIADAIRDDFEHRDDLDMLLKRWREISITPATAIRAASTWIRRI